MNLKKKNKILKINFRSKLNKFNKILLKINLRKTKKQKPWKNKNNFQNSRNNRQK